MKKKIILLFLLLIIILPMNVKALSVDKNNLTIEKGNNDTIGLYAEVETEVTEIAFTLVYTTYDVPAYFNLESGLTDTNPNGVAHKIIFPEPVSGKIKLGSINVEVVDSPKVTLGTINIHSASATTANGTINLNAQTINVTIGETETPDEEETPTTTPNEEEQQQEDPKQEEKKEETKKEENKEEEKKTNLLEKIESDIVTIELKEKVYVYKVRIEEGLEELDLKAIPKDDKYKVEITTQKISELTDNQIIITVKDGDNTEEYIIKVSTKKDIEEIEIDNDEFESTYKYKGKWITLIVVMSVVLLAGLLLTKKK